MGNLSSSLNIALQSLMSDQAAIDVTSNNIANANTPGYSRQRPVFDAEPPVTYGNVNFGMGVTLQQVQSVTDPVLELQIDQQTQNMGQLNSYLGAMQNVSSIFNETQGAGLQSALSQFFSSFQELSTNPTDTVLRQNVLNAGQALSTAFNESSTALGQVKSNLDQSVVQTVGQVNQLTSQIAQLDAQIGKLPVNAQSTGNLQDQRAQLINQLSNLAGINVTNLDDGIVSITTANGAALVAGNQSYTLSTQPDPTTGSQQVYDNGTNITSGIQGGELGGYIQARDQGVAGTKTQVDNLAAAVMSAVNNQNEAGYDPSGAAGGQFFASFTPTQAGTNDGAAAQMAVAITDPSKIAASSSASSPGDNTNALALANVQNQTVISGQTAPAYYTGLITGLGDDVSNATSQQQTENLVLQQLQNQRANISGVSMDQEAGNLMQYQLAYQASARVISTIDSLTQTTMSLIPLGG